MRPRKIPDPKFDLWPEPKRTWKMPQIPVAKLARLVGAAVFFVAMIWAPIALGAAGRAHQVKDVVTPYDFAYPETETYVAGYTNVVTTDDKGRINGTRMEPIYMERPTGRTLHTTRYNHTEPWPWTPTQGYMAGFTLSLVAAFLGACLLFS